MLDSPLTVLVADDDPSVRRLVELSFHLQGFEVVAAADGTEALELALCHRPEAAVLDVSMPGPDGFEVCRRLRAEPGWRPVIVMLTGRSQLGDRLAALDSGADDYVVKPVKLVDLVERVATLLSPSRSGQEGTGLSTLPGWPHLSGEIGKRLGAGAEVAVVHVDLHRFRVFNARYGYRRGDQVLGWVARLLVEVGAGDPDTVVGRLDGDDFLIVTTPERVPVLTEWLLPAFDAGITRFYDATDAERGWIEVADRRGRRHRQRLLTLAVGVATDRGRPGAHPRELVEVAAEVGRYAGRRQEASTIATDRRAERS